MAIITSSDTFTPVRQFNCANCGNALSVLNPRTRYIACQYCGSVLDATSEEHQILQKLTEPSEYQPFSFLRVGQVATFFGKPYQVIARTRWQQTYQEYSDEEGSSSYSDEVWQYDEWLMISEQRTYFYLIEDREGYYISNEIIPELPLLPDLKRAAHQQIKFFKNHFKQIIREFGEAKVLFFEGESNYHIRLDDEIQFAMYTTNHNYLYSVEWRLTQHKTIKEIEFFEEKPISTLDILQAFNQNEAAKSIFDRRQRYKEWFIGAAFTSALLLFLLLFSFVKSETPVFVQNIPLTTLNGDEGFVSSPIRITKQGLYRLKMTVSLGETNVDAFVIAFFEDKNGEILNKLEGNFYTETGFEDGEFYTEDVLNTSKIVQISETGEFFARIFLQKDEAANGELNLIITQGVWLSRWFILAFILTALLAVFLYFSYKKIR